MAYSTGLAGNNYPSVGQYKQPQEPSMYAAPQTNSGMMGAATQGMSIDSTPNPSVTNPQPVDPQMQALAEQNALAQAAGANGPLIADAAKGDISQTLQQLNSLPPDMQKKLLSLLKSQFGSLA